jgi:hypothetical protein
MGRKSVVTDRWLLAHFFLSVEASPSLQTCRF